MDFPQNTPVNAIPELPVAEPFPTVPPPPLPVPPTPPATTPTFVVKPKKKTFLLIVILLLLVAGLIIAFLFRKNLKSITASPVTLIYWGLFEPPSVFQQVIADYEKANPKVKINYTQENLKSYRERLQAALARGEGPDIFRMHQTWVPMLGSYLSPLPVTVYDATTFEKTFYPSAKNSLTRQGQYVGLPLEYDGLSLFYNEDLFRSRGQTPPKTWGELKTAACKLTSKDSNGRITTAGVAMGLTNNVDHWSDILGLMLLQNGADLKNPGFCTQESGEAVSSGEICLGRDALTFFTIFAGGQACLDEGLDIGPVWDDLMPNSTYAFASGNLAMYFGPSWRVFDIKQINPNLNFKIVAMPQLEGKNIAWSSFWVEAVSKNSKNQEAAWRFLQYLSSKEVMQKLYQTETALRNYFGEPYSRVDMAAMLSGQPYVSAFIEQAKTAQSWYLSSNTGDNGINDQIIKYYGDAVNAINKGTNAVSALNTAGQGVSQVLRQYGITK